MEFYEQIVHVKRSKGAVVFKILFAVCFVIFLFGSPLVLGMLGPILTLLWGAFGYFYLIPRLNIDFEYSMDKNLFSIDVIYNNEKRKRIIDFDVNDVIAIIPPESSGRNSAKIDKVYNYLSGNEGVTVYTIDLKIPKQTIRLLIEPDEKMQKMLQIYGAQHFLRY